MLVAFFIGFSSVFGQQNLPIKGVVNDSSNKPIQYATVGIYKNKDGKPLSVTYTDEKGSFTLNYSFSGEHWLMISHGGYENYWLNLSAEKDLSSLQIQLKNSVSELQGVTVKSTRRLVTMREDGISYNVENDPMANSDKALDLLRKTPMVSVDGDGSVTVNGQTSFRVLVNGRETAQFARNVTEALKSFPGSIIKRIDIITNPSAKYDAEGVGGIINIITKKNVVGYNATVSAWTNFFNPFDWSSNVSPGGNATLNMKKGKVGIVAGLVYDGNKNLTNRITESIQALIPSTFSKRTGEGISTSNTYSPEGNLELSYEIDSLNTISIYGTFDRTRNEDQNKKDFELIGTSAASSIMSTFEDAQTRRSIDWSSGFDYIKKFKSNPLKEFSIKLLGVFGEANLDNTSEQINSSGNNRFVLNDNYSNDRQYTIQTDYILPGKNSSTLEIGAKAILRKAISDYESYIKTVATDPYVVNPVNSDNFRYDQNVYSTYVSKRFRLGKFNFRTGLRMEHTVIDGNFIRSNTIVEQSYTKVLPNLLISTRLKNGQQITFSYSQRINRPYVRLLNPFINNIDSLNVTTGNPDLDPQLTHVFNSQFSINGKRLFTTFSIGYSFSNSNIIHGYIFNKTTGVTAWKPQNGGRNRFVFLNVSLNANPIDPLRMNLNGNVSYQNISSPSLGGQSNKGFSGQLNMNGSYTVGKKISLTWFSGYYFPVLLLQGSVNAYYSYGFGGRYAFVKDKLFANISLNNLFNKNGEFVRVRSFSDQNFMSENKTFNRFRGITFSLTWNFGKLSEGVSKKKGVSNTDLL
jgi:hypothetical protein